MNFILCLIEITVNKVFSGRVEEAPLKGRKSRKEKREQKEWRKFRR